jgi:multiple sugar transport system permease protein
MYAVLIAGVIVMVTPAYYTIVRSFTDERNAYRYPPVFWPSPPTSDNYTVIFNYIGGGGAEVPDTEQQWQDFWAQREGRERLLWGWTRNTLKITVLIMLGSFFSVTLAAYAFAKINFWGRDRLFGMLLGSMMLPNMLFLLPRYILFRAVGLLDTHWALILPSAAGSAFLIFLVRQFFMGLSDEVVDSARVDGANHWRIYWNIILPLSKPIAATLLVLSFLESWNSFMDPLIYLTSAEKFTLALGMTTLGGAYVQTPITVLAAASVILFVPIVIVYALGQQYFVRGLTAGSIK